MEKGKFVYAIELARPNDCWYDARENSALTEQNNWGFLADSDYAMVSGDSRILITYSEKSKEWQVEDEESEGYGSTLIEALKDHGGLSFVDITETKTNQVNANTRNSGDFMIENKTLAMTKNALVDGTKLGMAQQASHILIDGVHVILPDSVTSFLSIPQVEAAEKLAVPVLIHFLTDIIPDVPEADRIQRACGLALTAEVKDNVQALAESLRPLLTDLGKRLAQAGV
jgi:hypothetical protein